jgi:hypothetical protein
MRTGVIYMRTGAIYMRTGVIYMRSGVIYMRTGAIYMRTLCRKVKLWGESQTGQECRWRKFRLGKEV